MLDVEFSAVRLVFFHGNDDDSECSFVGRNFDYGSACAGEAGVAGQVAADVAGGFSLHQGGGPTEFPQGHRGQQGHGDHRRARGVHVF